MNGICALLSVFVVVLAFWKWHILRDLRLIASTIGTALRDRRSAWIGIVLGVLYLAVFAILGGRGGRIHILFGRLVWNSTPGEMLTGLALAVLVAVSISLFIYGVRGKGLPASITKGGVGLAGTCLAVLAGFCP
jgi:hypothetical protein